MPIISITKNMVEQRHHDLTITLDQLSALIKFAADRPGTEDYKNLVSRSALAAS
jgi:hypothetical protein